MREDRGNREEWKWLWKRGSNINEEENVDEYHREMCVRYGKEGQETAEWVCDMCVGERRRWESKAHVRERKVMRGKMWEYRKEREGWVKEGLWKKYFDSVLGRKKGSVARDRLEVRRTEPTGDGHTQVIVEGDEIKSRLDKMMREWMGDSTGVRQRWYNKGVGCLNGESETSIRNRERVLEGGALSEEVCPSEVVRNEILSWFKVKGETMSEQFKQDTLDTLRDIEKEEWEGRFSSKKKGKTGGTRNERVEHVAYGGEQCSEALRSVANGVWNGGRIPEAWCEDMVALAQKVVGSDDISKVRPLTCQDVVKKALMGITNWRGARVREKHKLFSTLQFGFVNEGSTEQNIIRVVCVVERAQQVGEDVCIGFQDVSKAFDSIERRCGKRLVWERMGVPLKLIDLYERVDERCTARITTSEGLSDGYNPARGIPQGGEESPQGWACVYDPLLTSMESEKFEGVAIVGWGGRGCVLKGVAFADDANWLGRTVASTTSKLQWASDFFYVVGPDMSVPKTFIVEIKGSIGGGVGKGGKETAVVVNRHTGREEEVRIITQQDTMQEHIRHLGVYFSTRRGKTGVTSERVKGMIQESISMIEKKGVHFHGGTLVSAMVIMRRVVYQLKVCDIKKRECEEMWSKVRGWIKKTAHVSRTFPTALVEGSTEWGGGGVSNIWMEVNLEKLVMIVRGSTRSEVGGDLDYYCQLKTVK